MSKSRPFPRAHPPRHATPPPCSSNWEHSNRRITGVIPHLFDLVLDIQAEEAAAAPPASTLAPGSHEGGGAPSALAGAAAAAALAQQLLAQPHGYAARYPALMRLLPRVGARTFLAVRTALIAELLAASGTSEAPSPAPGDLLVLVLAEHRREIEGARRLPHGHDGGSTVGWCRGEHAAASGAGPKKSKAAGKKGTGGGDSPVWDAVAARAALQRRLRAAGLDFLLELGPATPEAAARASGSTLSGAAELAALVSARHSTLLDASDPALGQRTADSAMALALALEATASADQPRPGGGACSWAAWAADELLHADAFRRWCSAWLADVAACLLHPRRLVRLRCVSYGLPALLRLDASATPACLIAALGAATPLATSAAERGDDLYSLRERHAAAVLAVARICRSFTSGVAVVSSAVLPVGPTDEAAAPVPLVSASLLRSALDFPDPELRLLALEVAVVSATTTALPSSAEYGAVLCYLRLNVKTASGDTRYRATRLLTAFMVRVTAGLAALRKRRAEGEAKVSWWT